MIKEHSNIDLRPYNTFGIEAKCRRLVEFEDASDLRHIFAERLAAGEKWNVLGGGSNILFTGDYDGTLLHPTGESVSIVSEEGESVTVRVSAGKKWDDFVQWCVDNGLWGIENLSHIPGLAGASPVQNIGAYGVEAGDRISSVECFDVPSISQVTLTKEHCGFGYRDSVFKHQLKGRCIITAVVFNLSRRANPILDYGDLSETVDRLGGPTLQNIRNAVIAIRRSKLPEPEVMGNAGSFFKNPVVETAVAEKLRAEYPSMPVYPSGTGSSVKLAAGWLIDQCGWKGKALGRAAVHDRQALVLVNRGGATGREVLGLASKIIGDVQSKFGITIEPEVNVL